MRQVGRRKCHCLIFTSTQCEYLLVLSVAIERVQGSHRRLGVERTRRVNINIKLRAGNRPRWLKKTKRNTNASLVQDRKHAEM